MRKYLWQSLLFTVIVLVASRSRAVDSSGIGLVTRLEFPGIVTSSVWLGSFLYVAAENDGITIIDTRDQQGYRIVGRLAIPGRGMQLKSDGQSLYVLDDSIGIRSYEIVADSVLRIQTEYPLSGGVRDLAFKETFLYAATGTDLVVLDNRNRVAPQFVNRISTENSIFDIEVAGNTIYLANGEAGLQLFNATQSYLPRPQQQFRIGNDTLRRIAVLGNSVIGLSRDILGVSLNDSSEPYIATRYHPQSPPEDIYVFGCGAFLANGMSGLRELEFLGYPYVEIAHYADNRYARCVTFTDRHVVVGEDSTLAFYQLLDPTSVGSSSPAHRPTTTALLTSYPNPFNATSTISYSLPTAGKVLLALYDLGGRAVVKLVDQQQSAGEYQVMLNGVGLVSGSYFLRLQTGSRVFVEKVVILK